MPVFTDSQVSVLNRSIARSLDAHIDHESCEMTLDDLLRTFVKPEHHAAARVAPELYVRQMYNANTFTFPHALKSNVADKESNVRFLVRLDWVSLPKSRGSTLPWLPPSYCGEFISDVDSAPFTAYMTKVSALTRTYNSMAMLLRALNTKCSSAGQLAFIWPAIKQLVDRASETGEQVDTLKKMVSRRPSGSMPIVTPLMRQWCQETGAALTYLQLMGKAPERLGVYGFSIALSSDVETIFDKDLLEAL